MGCCQSTDERREILLDYMRDKGYLKTVWSAFKLNNSNHGCLEYDEFCAVLFVAMEIYDKIQNGSSRQISHAMDEKDIELENINKYKRDHKVSSYMSSRRDIEEVLDIIAPKLAVQFDKDGDGLFSFDEFKDFGIYLKEEYIRVTTGYAAPQIKNESLTDNLIDKT